MRVIKLVVIEREVNPKYPQRPYHQRAYTVQAENKSDAQKMLTKLKESEGKEIKVLETIIIE